MLRAETPVDCLTYVLITPARNEAAFIEMTIKSVLMQTIRPARWIIVSDGSDDGTEELVSRYAAQHKWIELVTAPGRSERHFAGKVEAFNRGYSRLKDCDYQVIGNLDADISFCDTDYFEFLMRKFAENPRLGVCGTSYREGDVIYPYRFASREDVFGASQMFRRTCFEDIGGYLAVRSGGIDVIAVLSAQAHGWQTRTFTEKICVHHRKVGSAQHEAICRRLLNEGRKDYLLGCHPVWETCRSIYRMKSKPYVAGGLVLLCGFVWAMLRRDQRTIPPELMRLRRDDQLRRLKSLVRYSIVWRPRARPQRATLNS